MLLEQKIRYMNLTDAREADVKRQLRAAEHARNTADSKMTSRYDTQRENYAVEVNLHMDSMEKLASFREFLSGCGESYMIEEGAVCSIHYLDTKEDEIGLLVSPVSVIVPEVRIITLKSPLGAALRGKMLASEFSYQIGDQLVHGVITDLQ